MKTKKNLTLGLNCLSITSLCIILLAGCQSAPDKTPAQSAPEKNSSQPMPAMASTPPAAAVPAADNKQLLPPIRIKAGGTDGFKDSSGNAWLPDQGFTDGDTVERPELTITNTTDQRIYQSERYNMARFTESLPNGKYIVKLHFCETFEGITGPGMRVFSFNVAGIPFKDFDVWVKAGGPQRAYVETVPVEITNGKLEITFTPGIEYPQINGLEILPAS